MKKNLSCWLLIFCMITSCILLTSCSVPDREVEKKDVQNMVYACPMHPEIQSDSPGDCSKCGMALEPRDAQEMSEEHSDDSDVADVAEEDNESEHLGDL